MARCAVPARVVAGGTNIRATQPFEGAAPPNTARTSRQRPQTAQTGRGLQTAPTPDPTAARFDVAEVAKGGCVAACLPATAGGHQISHSERFDNSLSLNEVAEPSPKNRLVGTPKLKPRTARLPPNRDCAFDYLAPFAVPPQLPQASAPKRLSADSRPQLFPTCSKIPS